MLEDRQKFSLSLCDGEEKTKYKSNAAGFTLVELAIGMIIIGLLIGGVIKGYQILQGAKINATITQVESYKAAVNSFYNSYDALPGDMATAQQRIPGCDEVDTYCRNGDGNMVIGQAIDNPSYDVSQYEETTQFWKHLTLSGLLADSVSSDSNPDIPVWGETHPISKFRGGWHAVYMNDRNYGIYGLHLRLQANVEGDMPTDPGVHPISPINAHHIDRKIDDGYSTGGDVQAEYGVSGCRIGTAYAEQSGENCFMFFKID